jgi:hypothetical protein
MECLKSVHNIITPKQEDLVWCELSLDFGTNYMQPHPPNNPKLGWRKEKVVRKKSSKWVNISVWFKTHVFVSLNGKELLQYSWWQACPKQMIQMGTEKTKPI